MISAVEHITHVVRQELPEAELTLEVYRDPEIEDEHLILYARFLDYNESFLQRISNTRKKIRPYLMNKTGWLLLTTDLQTPG